MKIKTIEDWGHKTDTLDGKLLINNRKVKVTFPNGDSFQGTVSLSINGYEETCHNDRWIATDTHASLVIKNFMGTTFKFSMRENKNLNYEFC